MLQVCYRHLRNSAVPPFQAQLFSHDISKQTFLEAALVYTDLDKNTLNHVSSWSLLLTWINFDRKKKKKINPNMDK